jgi:hypothetical protein
MRGLFYPSGAVSFSVSKRTHVQVASTERAKRYPKEIRTRKFLL